MAKTTTAKNRRPNARQKEESRAAVRHRPIGKNGKRAATKFSERKSIEKLAAEQGIKPTRLEDILGKGADLWESDRAFEQFVEDIYARRREDRALAKP